ncbi:unnamed protein product [Strongylus vulgaris]|uniref:Uncharacterized protein n=1 Tax=Strongylus vulgaris TaxID=40348 RepID=A0A3P7JTX4_STRVU|nr:unnamed protein product [Strongylus vulgaris]
MRFVGIRDPKWPKSKKKMTEPEHVPDSEAKENSVPPVTMGEYCEQLRKWVSVNKLMNEMNCWQAFHQYNSMMMAYQSHMRTWQSLDNPMDDGLRQRRFQSVEG